MYYTRHYCIYNIKDILLLTRLENIFGISITALVRPNEKTPFGHVFDIPENHPHFNEIVKILPQESLNLYADVSDEQVSIMYIPNYSEQEYLSAKWLSVRSSFMKVCAENSEDVNGFRCIYSTGKAWSPGAHCVQNNHYVVKRSVNWGRNFIASSDIDELRLFCGDAAQNIFLKEDLSGIIYRPVIRKSTQLPIEDLYQLDTEHIVPDSSLIPVSHMHSCICPQCGMKMLRCDLDSYGRSQYGLMPDSLDANFDLWKTCPALLGPGEGNPVNGDSEFIVSQKMYRVLKNNNMTRNLWFTPLTGG